MLKLKFCSNKILVIVSYERMVDASGSILLVKNLPPTLSDDEKIGLLKCFGCDDVRVLPSSGRMKHCAFMTFRDHQSTTTALHRLHQLRVLGKVLTVQFARRATSVVDGSAEEENKPDHNAGIREVCHCTRKLPRISPHLAYPSNPLLKYSYPEPDANILINICGALLSTPSFYTQVLHLMNKLNLYPPFSSATFIPPLLTEFFGKFTNVSFPEVVSHHSNLLPSPPRPPDLSPTPPCPTESSESEMESDGVASMDLNVLPPQQMARKRKQLSTDPHRKLQRLMDQSANPHQEESKSLTKDVFEDYDASAKVPISLSIPTSLQVESDQTSFDPRDEGSGFGKILPLNPPHVGDPPAEKSDYLVTKNFMTEKDLRKGRMSDKEMKSHPLLKRHDPGPPSCRLYVKNLHKKVTEGDLQHLFGCFVDVTNKNEVQMFDVRLMNRGRMKGQAFIGLPSVAAASRAVEGTNGFLLLGKPLVVSFARSAKPQQGEGPG